MSTPAIVDNSELHPSSKNVLTRFSRLLIGLWFGQPLDKATANQGAAKGIPLRRWYLRLHLREADEFGNQPLPTQYRAELRRCHSIEQVLTTSAFKVFADNLLDLVKQAGPAQPDFAYLLGATWQDGVLVSRSERAKTQAITHWAFVLMVFALCKNTQIEQKANSKAFAQCLGMPATNQGSEPSNSQKGTPALSEYRFKQLQQVQDIDGFFVAMHRLGKRFENTLPALSTAIAACDWLSQTQFSPKTTTSPTQRVNITWAMAYHNMLSV